VSGPIRVLFASVYDAGDVRAWSGTPYHMYRALVASRARYRLRARYGSASRCPSRWPRRCTTG
jgi:hypothetical protein